MTPEQRKEAQRLESLERAHAVRTRRGQLKRDMAAGKVKLSDVLRDEDELLATMRIRDLLLAVPGLGKAKTPRVLAALHFSNSTQLGSVSARRREDLLARLHTDFPAYKGRL